MLNDVTCSEKKLFTLLHISDRAVMDEDRFVKQNEDNLEEIIDKQTIRLQELDMATALIKSKQNIKGELQDAHEEVQQISGGISEAKRMLSRMHEQNSRLKEIFTLVETLDKRILHQERNIPPELIQGYQDAMYTPLSEYPINPTHQSTRKTPNSVRNITTFEKEETVKDCKRTLFNEPEVCPTIQFITAEEFNAVPKYIIGRQTVNSLETINHFINAINQTLIAKYTLLSMGKAVAQKKGDINLYLYYKKQELDIRDEDGYLYFFTAEDYYRQTKTKIDKTKLNLLTALRHCKRLRECRIRNELRYVITSH
ncbi:PREDICTED: spindle and kinetochore-associated protein 1-like isoform X2 [Acromyrmex echinatior]|uniref:spindle and kinetochore-associated protein 1-like isoform X2 n=1 Tax=Acromyrmex echinatior TaxID=103372 RepID=UPI000580B8A8|nr:PREDICTED: spindle and kinetochore-associated protein 1-like isoform X2 [Acromyrmex echinatior]